MIFMRHNGLPVAGKFLAVLIAVSILSTTSLSAHVFAQKQQVTLTAIVAEPKERWDILFASATEKLEEKHPDVDINIDYRVLPYDATRRQILTAMAGQTPIDIVSIDQIWLGEFAQGGFLTDLSTLAQQWGRESDWYPQNWEGGKYEDKVYGIWAWTDVRAMWYWKDLLSQAGVEPNSTKTWEGYIDASQKLNNAHVDKGIQGVHLVGAGHSPDMWFPYLWMLGGSILEQKEGHPSKGTYWYPAYNSDQGIKSLEFLKKQVEAGIRPQINHFWGQEFADKKFAIMLEGSWLLGQFPKDQWPELENTIGMIPAFPVMTDGNSTSTMMGGWLLGIPAASTNKDLAWELVTTMVDPVVLTPMLKEQGYLPTQKSIGEGEFAAELEETIPYYKQLISLIEQGQGRPNIPEYSQVAEHIKQAIDEVYFSQKDPKQALDEAAAKSAKVLGWTE